MNATPRRTPRDRRALDLTLALTAVGLSCCCQGSAPEVRDAPDADLPAFVPWGRAADDLSDAERAVLDAMDLPHDGLRMIPGAALRLGLGSSGLRAASGVQQLALPGDGRLIISLDLDGQLRGWDADTGRQRLPTARAPSATAMALSADGRHLVTVGSDRNVRFFEVHPTELRPIASVWRGEVILAVAISPDGATVAAAGVGGAINLYNAKGQSLGALGLASTVTKALSFSPDGLTLAVASHNDILLVDAPTRRLRANLKGHAAEVQTLAFSPDGLTLASTSADMTLRLWDATSGALRRAAPLQHHHTGAVATLAFSPDGRALLTGANDGVRRWTSPTLPDDAMTASTLSTQGRALALSADGRRLALSGPSGAILIADPTTGRPVKGLSNNNVARILARAPDQRTLALLMDNGHIALWDATSGATTRTLPTASPLTLALCFLPDGHLLAARATRPYGDYGGLTADPIELFDPDTGDLKHTLIGHEARVNAVDFAPGCGALLSGSGDSHKGADVSARLWDTATGAALGAWNLSNPAAALDTLGWVGFSPDGRWFAAAGTGTLTLFDRADPRQGRNMTQAHAAGAAFSPDGRRLVSAGGYSDVELWDLDTQARTLWRREGSPIPWISDADFALDEPVVFIAEERGLMRWAPDRKATLLAVDTLGDPALQVAALPQGKVALRTRRGLLMVFEVKDPPP